jgi:hypothetical protein
MDLKSLVGQTFSESDFYELLLTDIEDHFDEYWSHFVHIYFEREDFTKIKISDIVFFQNIFEMTNESKKIIEKKEWYEIAENNGHHFNLLLVRFDRTGFMSSIKREATHTEEWSRGWAVENPASPPMTSDEMRQAFLELSDLFSEQMTTQDLRSKKAI